MGLLEVTCGLVDASYSLPEWQAVKLTFFAPCLYVLPVKRSLLWGRAQAYFLNSSGNQAYHKPHYNLDSNLCYWLLLPGQVHIQATDLSILTV